MQLKSGVRLKSTVCNGEVMVITAPEGSTTLTCGGAAMADAANDVTKGDIDPDHAEGVLIGKRYINEEGNLELLCIKPGDGSLAVAGKPLAMKTAKKLPKSD
jgi:hypothetical protein|tara:strand:+ start:2054 stop:2359 length:306 start_codon:yes stop_codon:yes gene_type:complete